MFKSLWTMMHVSDIDEGNETGFKELGSVNLPGGWIRGNTATASHLNRSLSFCSENSSSIS